MNPEQNKPTSSHINRVWEDDGMTLFHWIGWLGLMVEEEDDLKIYRWSWSDHKVKGRRENCSMEPTTYLTLFGMNCMFLHPLQEHAELHLCPSRWQGQ